MRIVFMGTPEFAAPALSAIHSEGHEVKYVITQRDKAKDRGKKVGYPPVKEKALSLGIEVLQPDRLKGNAEITGVLADSEPDMIVVAAYGHVLPADVLNIPRLGCLNIHASLLPRWRGAAPIQRAIIEGDEKTGVTIMRMAEGIDTGDILMSRSTEIGGKTASELQNELAAMGAELIVLTIAAMEKGAINGYAQDEKLATYAPMIFKQDGELDFRESPEKLERMVRGFNPWPGAYTFHRGEMMKIWEAFVEKKDNPHGAGTVTDFSDAGIEVSAGGGTLLITEIQAPGKKRIKIKEYLKGNKIEKFAILG